MSAVLPPAQTILSHRRDRMPCSSTARRRTFQRHVAVRALDDEAGAGEFSRAQRADQKGHVLAGLQHPAPEISADGAGTDHENAHCLVPFVVVLEERMAIRVFLP